VEKIVKKITLLTCRDGLSLEEEEKSRKEKRCQEPFRQSV